ncbi:hypothetical protein IFM89_038096 [Coptis chinensis]|uniref:Bet v I/Major latex protein domain-containing protein n=1 Tax=Coptis chinensis TaxID=261450 RepID=A0A835LNX3_9MAGN|nr:hypothetical protein IFM89_038096 [Coptis chinensis]
MATETSKLEIVKEVKCSPHKFYEMIKYTLHHLPTVCPELVPGADIIEGDGESVGTVRLWKYVIPGTTEILEAKEKTKVIDDENMLIVLDICEGDHTNHYAQVVEKIQIIPKGWGLSKMDS